jgi:His-Xaa-Ser system protein HxsD
MIEGNKVVIKIDLATYTRIAALKTCYVFQDKCHTSLDTESESVIKATLILKNESLSLPEIEKQFTDELIDQQIRVENERQFSDIRKLIVEQAFKPISFAELKTKIRKR